MYIRLSKCGYSVELLAFTVIENSKKCRPLRNRYS